MADHLRRKAVAGITRMTGLLHPSPMSGSRHLRVKVTVPGQAILRVGVKPRAGPQTRIGFSLRFCYNAA
jgi:hypothetical protein